MSQISLTDLPSDVLLKIFLHLDTQDVLNCSITCKYFFDSCNENLLWKHLHKKRFPHIKKVDALSKYDLKKLNIKSCIWKIRYCKTLHSILTFKSAEQKYRLLRRHQFTKFLENNNENNDNVTKQRNFHRYPLNIAFLNDQNVSSDQFLSENSYIHHSDLHDLKPHHSPIYPLGYYEFNYIHGIEDNLFKVVIRNPLNDNKSIKHTLHKVDAIVFGITYSSTGLEYLEETIPLIKEYVTGIPIGIIKFIDRDNDNYLQEINYRFNQLIEKNSPLNIRCIQTDQDTFTNLMYKLISAIKFPT